MKQTDVTSCLGVFPRNYNQEHLSTCAKSKKSHDEQRQETIRNKLCQMQEVYKNEDVRVLQETLTRAGSTLQSEFTYTLDMSNQKRSKIGSKNSNVLDKTYKRKTNTHLIVIVNTQGLALHLIVIAKVQ
eukprot:7355965-Ditylum_brightwellii.AAC.1